MAKKTVIDMGNYVPKDSEYKAMYWCINNGIKISPQAKNTFEWNIVIDINGKINISPESYTKIIIWKKIFEYYLYYHKKYENKV